LIWLQEQARTETEEEASETERVAEEVVRRTRTLVAPTRTRSGGGVLHLPLEKTIEGTVEMIAVVEGSTDTIDPTGTAGTEASEVDSLEMTAVEVAATASVGIGMTVMETGGGVLRHPRNAHGLT